MKYAEFETLEAYNAVNIAIVAFKDAASGGEYTRTGTVYEYDHEPTPMNGLYYMPALPELVQAGIFDGVTLLDEMPVEIIEE